MRGAADTAHRCGSFARSAEGLGLLLLSQLYTRQRDAGRRGCPQRPSARGRGASAHHHAMQEASATAGAVATTSLGCWLHLETCTLPAAGGSRQASRTLPAQPTIGPLAPQLLPLTIPHGCRWLLQHRQRQWPRRRLSWCAAAVLLGPAKRTCVPATACTHFMPGPRTLHNVAICCHAYCTAGTARCHPAAPSAPALLHFPPLHCRPLHHHGRSAIASPDRLHPLGYHPPYCFNCRRPLRRPWERCARQT